MSQRRRVRNNALMLATTVTLNRENIFIDDAYAREAVETLYRVQRHHPFDLYGFVIMPDHIHVLLNVPAPNTISKVMNVYKSGMTFNTGIRQLWQPRYHLRFIRNGWNALQYIHMNPVKKEMVKSSEDYPWSSACGKWSVMSL